MRNPVRNFGLHATVAILGIAGAIATVLTYLVLAGTLSTKDAYGLNAIVPTSASLTPGARVTMAGAQVGRVASIERRGYATLVRMELTDDRVYPVPADTRVTISQRTPVGEAYVALAPGRSTRTLREDAVLPIRRATEYVDVDQLLTILRGRPRTETRALLRGTADALRGKGAELNDTLGRTSEIVQASGRVFVVLDDNRRQTAALIDHVGRLTAAVSERSGAIRSVADRGLVAMRALASRDDELARTLEVLPSTLRQVERTSGTLGRTSTIAAPVVADLATTVRDLRPAVEDLQPAAATGRRVVAELGRAAAPLRQALDEATRTAKPLGAALPELHRTVCQLNPMVRYIAPYAKDLVMPLMGLGSSSNSYDAIGHLIRLQPIVGENSAVGVPASVSAAMQTLVRSGLFAKGHALSWNPYPEPGRIGKDKAEDGKTIANAAALAATGWKYPRIHADC